MVILVSHIDACSTKWRFAFDIASPIADRPSDAQLGKKRKFESVVCDDEPETSLPGETSTPVAPPPVVPVLSSPQLESPLSRGSNYFELSLDNGKLHCICKCKAPVNGKVARAPKNFNNIHGMVNGKDRFLICKWSHFRTMEEKVKQVLSPLCSHVVSNDETHNCRMCKKKCSNCLALFPPRRPEESWNFCSLQHLLDFGKQFLSSSWTAHCREKTGASLESQTNK